MPLVSHRVLIDASFDAIWQHLLEKIEAPEKYVPAVTRSEIVSRPATNAVERVMFVSAGDGDERPTRELISHDRSTGTVIFLLKDNPTFTGLVTNTVMEAESGCELDYTLNWVERPGIDTQDDVDWQAMIRDAVEHTKRLVEASTSG